MPSVRPSDFKVDEIVVTPDSEELSTIVEDEKATEDHHRNVLSVLIDSLISKGVIGGAAATEMKTALDERTDSGVSDSKTSSALETSFASSGNE